MLADGDSFTHDRGGRRVLPGLHQPLETAVRDGAARRPAREVSRATADRADAGAGSAHLGEDAAEAARRQHALEHAQAGASVLGISHMLVARVWRRAGLQPHRFERYMLSDDPDFEQKAADVIGLYLNPPQHAVGVRRR